MPRATSATDRACAECLRRSYLIAYLAPRIAGLLARRDGGSPGLLALDEERLIEAVAGRRGDGARRLVGEFCGASAQRALECAGVRALCRHGRAYPEPLRQLVDPPAALFFTGPADRLARLTREPVVAVVGARRASGYGEEVAYELGRGLGAAGVTVVSGLALGIDAAAHRGCLDAGGGALAVLAGGTDVPYPRANRALYERVLQRGTLVSELPPGQRPFRWSFPARNRVMAGLSAMTVVVEAADPSGSLITAAYAADLGRTVGAVPGPVTARRSAGSNRLLRDGAPVIRGAGDVLDELFGVGAGAAVPAPPRAADQLSPRLREVLDAVEAGQGLEAIAHGAGLTAAELRRVLGQLESLRLVRRSGLAGYERTARG
jgi:DNA processing protein